MKKNPEVKGVKCMMTMLKVFRGCIDTKTLPRINSPCHKILKEIIKVNKYLK